jgi:hypothetical protein
MERVVVERMRSGANAWYSAEVANRLSAASDSNSMMRSGVQFARERDNGTPAHEVAATVLFYHGRNLPDAFGVCALVVDFDFNDQVRPHRSLCWSSSEESA